MNTAAHSDRSLITPAALVRHAAVLLFAALATSAGGPAGDSSRPPSSSRPPGWTLITQPLRATTCVGRARPRPPNLPASSSPSKLGQQLFDAGWVQPGRRPASRMHRPHPRGSDRWSSVASLIRWGSPALFKQRYGLEPQLAESPTAPALLSDRLTCGSRRRRRRCLKRSAFTTASRSAGCCRTSPAPPLRPQSEDGLGHLRGTLHRRAGSLVSLSPPPVALLRPGWSWRGCLSCLA